MPLSTVEVRDKTLMLGKLFESRLSLVVDEAHSTFNHGKVQCPIRRAGLRNPNVDLRRLGLVEERGPYRRTIACI